MTDRLSGVALRTGEDYTNWHAALSASWTRPTNETHWAEQMYDQGTIPFVHLMIDDTMFNIASGMHSAAITTWLEALLRYQQSGRRMVVVPYPEMNGNWTPYGQEQPVNHSAFIVAFRAIVDEGKAMGLNREHIQWSFAPNDKGWPGDRLGSWYPGDEWCDWIGMSAYNWGGIFDDKPWLTPAEVIDPVVKEVRSFTARPIVITQTGAGHRDSRTPQWLSDLAAYTHQWQNIEGFIYFSISEFEYGPGRDDFNDRVEVLESVRPDHWFQEEEAVMGSRAADNALGELQEAFPEVRAGVWNCRHFNNDPSKPWSQHAWGNALDLHRDGWPYEVSNRNYAFLDPIYTFLKTYQEELSIRKLLWRVKDHHDHIHVDFWPKGYGQPPCDGGSLRMQYNNGRVVNGDPGPANGVIELPDKELITMSDAQVLEKGMSGVAVADLQKMLIELDYDLGNWDPFGPGYPAGADGEYGGATVTAVTAYQEQRQLVMTGKADGVTLFYIREDLGYAGQSELYPHSHGFVVNIPAVTVTAATEVTP